MKKTFFLSAIMLTAFLGGRIQAQDTLRSDGLPDSYYHGMWANGDTIAIAEVGIDANYYVEKAIAYHSPDSLTIYGLAASLNLSDHTDIHPSFTYQDTTLDSIYCYVRLYLPIGDSLRVVAEKRVHMRDTPVSYYLALNRWDSSRPTQFLDPIPVYECFLDTPVTVIDSFYVGFAYDKDKVTYNDSLQTYVYPYRYEITCNSFRDVFHWPMKESVTTALRYAPDLVSNPPRTPGAWFIYTTHTPPPCPFLHAITAPQDTTVIPIDTTVTPVDTTVIPIDTTVTPIDTVTPGGDTLGVQTADLVSRYVSVMPNPAHERAEVLSSFGLTLIELYDEQGRLLRTLPAAGLRATLDLHSLPPSTYLLRIHTPAGTTTKKLLVR